MATGSRGESRLLGLKVALVHDWLTGMRGGERCLEVLCEVFPEAVIHSLVYKPGAVSPLIERHAIRTAFTQRLPGIQSSYRHYLPIFPLAIRTLDFHGYDLVISSSHCVAKGIRIPPGTCHLSYIFTPMRYAWDQFDSYFEPGRAGLLVRAGMTCLRPALRRWDAASNADVYQFIAISNHVADRVRRYYGRDSVVVYPPVDWQAFSASGQDEGFYLMVTALAPYKRVDLAVEAAKAAGISLKIVGSGQDEKRLRKLGGATIEWLGWQPDEAVRSYYARCRALIFPGEEDFGIVPLEAMACGKPVIAYAKGGALETVVPLRTESFPPGGLQGSRERPTGVFFHEPSAESLVQAIRLFEARRTEFDPHAIRQHVEPFDRTHFKARLRAVIDLHYARYLESRHAQTA